jgi:peptidoglycan/LPS O-acetylase OafA/YrhL
MENSLVSSSAVEPTIKPSSNRIWFLQMLRGIAAMAVVLFHLFIIFWVSNDIVQTVCPTPIVHYTHPWLMAVKNLFDFLHLNVGAFGVALFFLISGFVIPISLEKQSTRNFLIQRFFRIYPTYWIGMLVTAGFLAISAYYLHQPVFYNLQELLINATLFLRRWVEAPSIDGINWTLEVEIGFYVLMALFTQFFSTQKLKHLVILPIVLSLFSVIVKIFFLKFHSALLIFMLMGTGFLNFYKQYFTLKQFAIYNAVAMACFLVAIHLNRDLHHEPSFTTYYYALACFSALYYFREKIPYNGVLDFISTISYPLYIVHGFNSYVIMSFLYQVIPNYWVCTGAGLLFSFSAAILLHYLAEKPSLKLGKRIHG